MIRCRNCKQGIDKDHITEKENGGGFIAKCPFCGAVNNVKCRHSDGKIRSIKVRKELVPI